MQHAKKLKKWVSKDLILCFRNLGLTGAAKDLGVQPTLILGWLDGLEIPGVYENKLFVLADDVKNRLRATKSDDYEKPTRTKRSKWNRYEDNYLIHNWGRLNREQIGRNLKRGIPACVARIRHLTGSSSPIAAIDGYTQSSLARLTGYSHKRIRQAADALGLRKGLSQEGGGSPGRLGWDNRQWRINREDADRIMTWVTEHDAEAYKLACRWGKNSDQCIACGLKENKHYSKNMCRNCYCKHQRRVRLGMPSILNGQLGAPHGPG